MVVHAFPAAKLGALLLRQISKPIANFLKERAKKHPIFRTYLCMPPAQLYNWCEIQMKMWILNLGKPVQVPPLNEAMAIDLGANLLGEGIIFLIAGGVLMMEYSRQVRKEEKKEAARKDELSVLNYTIQELYFQIERQDAQIRELHRAVNDLDGKAIQKPWKFSSSSSHTALSAGSIDSGKDKPPPSGVTPRVSPKPQAEATVASQNVETKQHHHHHHHQPHHDVVPMHLEHINKVLSGEPGVLLTAVSYLTNEIFNYKSDHFRDIHLQDQR